MKKSREAIAYAIKLLKENLSEKFIYHSLEHTKNVQRGVVRFAKYEGVSASDLTLLKVAAAFHDTGYTISALNHEENSAQITQETLPKFDFTTTEIEQICQLILATKLSYTPQTNLEKIIRDADVEYLGRRSFYEQSYRFRVELLICNQMVFSEQEWLEFEIKFLRNIKFLSPAGQALREPTKLKNLAVFEQLYYNLTGAEL